MLFLSLCPRLIAKTYTVLFRASASRHARTSALAEDRDRARRLARQVSTAVMHVPTADEMQRYRDSQEAPPSPAAPHGVAAAHSAATGTPLRPRIHSNRSAFSNDDHSSAQVLERVARSSISHTARRPSTAAIERRLSRAQITPSSAVSPRPRPSVGRASRHDAFERI